VFNIDLTKWKTKTEIPRELKTKDITINERQLRRFFEKHNNDFFNGQVDTFVIHSGKGYKLTSDKDEIMQHREDYKKRALNMLWKYSQISKAVGEHCNLQMDLKDLDVNL